MHGAHIFDCCCTWLICAKQHFLAARCGRTTDTDWRHALHSHTAQSRYCCIWLCANAICQREWKFTQYRVQCCRITRFVRRWTGILCPKIPNRNFYNKMMASSFMSFSGWFSPGAHLHCCWVSPLRMEVQTTITYKRTHHLHGMFIGKWRFFSLFRYIRVQNKEQSSIVSVECHLAVGRQIPCCNSQLCMGLRLFNIIIIEFSDRNLKPCYLLCT